MNRLAFEQRSHTSDGAQLGDDPQDRQGLARSGGSVEDAWRRRSELLFERLVVRWEIAGLPLDDQKMLIGRYRMADAATLRSGCGGRSAPV